MIIVLTENKAIQDLFQKSTMYYKDLSPLSSSFAAPRAGEPPQSAQDKARMDKEYLSLMAELGEAPVPSSGGGHSNNQNSSHNRGNNQPPPVS